MTTRYCKYCGREDVRATYGSMLPYCRSAKQGEIFMCKFEERTEKTVWKYRLEPYTCEIEMPVDAVVLCIQLQDKWPFMWVLCSPSAKREKRTFLSFGTGQPVPAYNAMYVGTFQMNDGIVFHTFQEIR